VGLLTTVVATSYAVASPQTTPILCDVSPARTLLLVSLLAAALVSFIYLRSRQGDGEVLVSAQRHAQVLTPAGVARVVQTAPDPDTQALGSSATCTPLGRGELHNPWRCTIAYPSGRRIAYTVEISADGSYSGDNQVVYDRGTTRTGPGSISGCCIVIP
jgi:hypothetical protein